MNRFFTKSIGIAALLGVVGISQPAQAALSLQLSDGATTVTVQDGGIGDSNPLAGVITYIGGVGVWFLNVSTGFTNPGLFGPGHLDLNTINSSTGAGTLDVMLTNTGMSAPLPGTSLTMNWGGTMTGGTASASVFSDDSDSAFGLTDNLANLGPFSGAFSGSTAATIPGTYNGTYSMTQRVSLTATRAASYSGDLELIPEPANVALLGLGLAGLAARRRRAV